MRTRRCVMWRKGGTCNSMYAYGTIKCDGHRPPTDCPYGRMTV